MSNLFKQNMTLPEMERLLEQYCKNDGTAINVTEKIPLSRDDMVLMRSYLDTFVNLKGDVSAFYDVNLAIIITWIFAEKYDGDAQYAAQLTFVSTLSSIVTIPLMSLLFT